MALPFPKSTQVTNWSTTFPNQDCSCGPAKLLIFPICFLPGLALLADKATKFGHALPQITSPSLVANLLLLVASSPVKLQFLPFKAAEEEERTGIASGKGATGFHSYPKF